MAMRGGYGGDGGGRRCSDGWKGVRGVESVRKGTTVRAREGIYVFIYTASRYCITLFNKGAR